MRLPLRQRKPILELMRKPAQRHRRLRRRVRVPLQELPIMLISKRVLRQQNVPDMSGPSLAPLNRPPAQHRPATEPRAHDRNEQRLELLVRQRIRRHAIPRRAIDCESHTRPAPPPAHRPSTAPRSPADARRTPPATPRGSDSCPKTRGPSSASPSSTPSIVAGPGVASPTVDDLGERNLQPFRRLLRRIHDRRNRTLRPFLRRGPKLLGHIHNLPPLIPHRQRAGGPADVDAKKITQCAIPVTRIESDRQSAARLSAIRSFPDKPALAASFPKAICWPNSSRKKVDSCQTPP